MISIDTEWTFRGYPNLLLQDSGILQRASLRPERATGVVEAGRATRQLGAGCRQESQHKWTRRPWHFNAVERRPPESDRYMDHGGRNRARGLTVTHIKVL
jgi:hypothetical protein